MFAVPVLHAHCAAIDESGSNIGYPGVIYRQPSKEHVDGQDNSNRNTEIVRLSEAGMTHTAIGERFGITRQRVSAIVSRHAQQDNERVTELKRKYHDLEGVARKPPAQHSAIGKIIYDETGEVVRNESVRVAAVREQRMLIGEMRKEEDRKEVLSDAEQQAQVQEVVGFLESGARPQ